MHSLPLRRIDLSADRYQVKNALGSQVNLADVRALEREMEEVLATAPQQYIVMTKRVLCHPMS